MVSRSEKHKKEKEVRKQKVKSLAIINTILFFSVVLVVSVALLPDKAGKYSDEIPYIGSKLDWLLDKSTGWMRKDKQNYTDLAAGENSEDMTEEQGIDTAIDSVKDEDIVKDNEGISHEPAMEETDGQTPGQDETQSSDGTVSMTFTGDLLIEQYVQQQVEQNGGYHYLFEKALFYLSEPDITIGNLEMPLTKRGVPAKQQYVYKGAPEVAESLVDAGFDIVSLANNHALDQGIKGLEDTITYLDKARLAHVGTGMNEEEAYKPVFKEVNGIKVAFLAMSRVLPYAEWKAMGNRAGVADAYDYNRAAEAVRAAKEQADITVVLIHWGKERTTQLEEHQTELGKLFIDSGADLVIGNHPHILQGFEHYNGKWIAYSLGNFIFSTYPKDAEAQTGVLDAKCTKEGNCELVFHPMYIDLARPVPMAAEDAAELLRTIEKNSINVKITADGQLNAS